MNVGAYVFSILSAALTLVVIVEMLRRRRLRERHAIWWLIAGSIALTISIFPQLIDALAGVIGVEEPVNLVFFTCLIILFLVCVQFSSELTALEDKTRTLAEETALLNRRVKNLEAPIKRTGIGD